MNININVDYPSAGDLTAVYDAVRFWRVFAARRIEGKEIWEITLQYRMVGCCAQYIDCACWWTLFPGCCAELLCRTVKLFVTQFTSEVASTVFSWNGGSYCCVYIAVERPPPAHPLSLISASYKIGERLRMLWDGLIHSSRQISFSLCLYLRACDIGRI